MLQSPHPPLVGCANKAGSLPSGRVMLSHSLKRYYGPLRLPMQPVAISLPYTQQLIFLGHHCTGSPALDRLSSAACHPCYPGRKHPLLPFSQRVSTGLPHLTRGSASPVQVTRLPVGSLALRPATSPCGNLRPLIAQTPLPRATPAYGQLLGRDFNPPDKRLLLRTVRSAKRMCHMLTHSWLTIGHMLTPRINIFS